MESNDEKVLAEIRALLKLVLCSFGSEMFGRFQDESTQFRKKIIAKYPNKEYKKSQLWNLLGGSSVTREQAPNLDLPGEDSVEKFVRGFFNLNK